MKPVAPLTEIHQQGATCPQRQHVNTRVPVCRPLPPRCPSRDTDSMEPPATGFPTRARTSLSGSFASSLNAGRGWRQNSCISPAKKLFCDGSNARLLNGIFGAKYGRGCRRRGRTVLYSTLVPFQRWKVLCVVSRRDTIRMNLPVLVRFIMFRIITRSVVAR